jgi:hypothetical protein
MSSLLNWSSASNKKNASFAHQIFFYLIAGKAPCSKENLAAAHSGIDDLEEVKLLSRKPHHSKPDKGDIDLRSLLHEHNKTLPKVRVNGHENARRGPYSYILHHKLTYHSTHSCENYLMT